MFIANRRIPLAAALLVLVAALAAAASAQSAPESKSNSLYQRLGGWYPFRW